MAQREYKAPSLKLLIVHAVIYAIVITILWIIYARQDAASFGSTYPWPAWFTAGWGVAVVAHLCNVFFDNNRNHQDIYYEKYLYERDN